MLDSALAGRVLGRLKLAPPPPPTLAGLAALYAAWCRSVSFDNVRKLIHLHRADPGPLPGGSAEDFFETWLRDGTGGTCWSGNGALHALLSALGFAARRGLATMLVAPNIPPNHGTVVVAVEGRDYLVDASILHGAPLELVDTPPETPVHPAWGVRYAERGGERLVRWRPLHRPDGIDCRIEALDLSAEQFLDFHERSRAWSPFNYQLYGRINRENSVVGTAFGQQIEFTAAGNIVQRTLDERQRAEFLAGKLGIREDAADRLPPERPTPPPPLPPS